MLLILLPLFPEHWDHRYKPPQPASCPLRFMQKPGQSSSPETLAELLVLGRVCIFFFFFLEMELIYLSFPLLVTMAHYRRQPGLGLQLNG